MSTELNSIDKKEEVTYKITKEEAEANIRSIKRWCRGPLVLPEEVVVEFRKKINADNADFESIKKDLEAHHKYLHGSTSLMSLASAGSVVGLEAQCHRLLFSRNDDFGLSVCGANDNDLILSEPLDGKAHESKCPRCGTEKTWQPPKFEIAG